MRLVRCLCLFSLCVPLTIASPGCGGSDEAGPMATDSELEAYGKGRSQGYRLRRNVHERW